MSALSRAELHALRRAGHRLRPRVTIGRAGVTTPMVEQVRAAFPREGLLKVRVTGRRGEEVDAVGRALAAEVPCIVVGRIGFVLTLFRAANVGYLAGAAP